MTTLRSRYCGVSERTEFRMITITQSDISASGGVLAALADKSCECVRAVLKSGWKATPPEILESLERIIVHTEPHLDEYFAELLFRSCLPREKQQCEFIEQSVFSATNDLGCQHLLRAEGGGA